MGANRGLCVNTHTRLAPNTDTCGTTLSHEVFDSLIRTMMRVFAPREETNCSLIAYSITKQPSTNNAGLLTLPRWSLIEI